MRLKSTVIFSFVALIPFSVLGQVTLPKADVLKKNKVKEVIVFQHNLPSVYADSTQLKASTQLDQPPFIWAKYWLNNSGYPDSMHNYIKGVVFRKEVFKYESKGQLKSIEAFNHKNESVNIEIATIGSKGQIEYTISSKGVLKTVKLTDKSHRVIQAKIYTESSIYGYDSMLYYHDFKSDTSVETYYSNGEVIHQLTKKWIGAKPDSFYQSFYQSNSEAGRMPSYAVMFPVDANGFLVVPNDMAFGEMFSKINYQNRYKLYDPFDIKLSRLMKEVELVYQSKTIEQQRKNVTHRHYYTFDYAVK